MWANKNDYTDLQAAIMMLVYEKKVLSMEDTKDRLEHFLQDKWHDYVNSHISQYKQEKKIFNKPYVFSIITQSLGKYRIYVIARSRKQAISYALEQGYQVLNIEDMPMDQDWIAVNHKGEEVAKPLRKIRDDITDVPSILGAF